MSIFSLSTSNVLVCLTITFSFEMFICQSCCKPCNTENRYDTKYSYDSHLAFERSRYLLPRFFWKRYHLAVYWNSFPFSAVLYYFSLIENTFSAFETVTFSSSSSSSSPYLALQTFKWFLACSTIYRTSLMAVRLKQSLISSITSTNHLKILVYRHSLFSGVKERTYFLYSTVIPLNL